MTTTQLINSLKSLPDCFKNSEIGVSHSYPDYDGFLELVLEHHCSYYFIDEATGKLYNGQCEKDCAEVKRIRGDFLEAAELAREKALEERFQRKLSENPEDPWVKSVIKYKLEDLVAKVTPENQHPEVDWGTPMGKEIL